ncbi:MAG: hypothetical protein QF915_00605, partial [Candidatus Woesearchaeota archaeon]|nr:hypothetical protein [Candidatus Woesearchaeota archaeon]
ITQQLLDPKIIAKQGFFKEEYVTKALSGLETSSLFYSRQLWSLLNFQLWHNQFIENDNLKKPTQI